MANGDIPVTGSAPGTTGSFKIQAANRRSDNLDHLEIRTGGKSLRIFVDPGDGTPPFSHDLDDRGWRMEITAR